MTLPLYKPEKKYERYDMLSGERKKLVQPVFLSAEEKFQRWKQQEYKRYEGYREGLHCETENTPLDITVVRKIIKECI